MKFLLRYRPEVIADLDAGRRWYEERSAGLGSDFIVECSEALARIQRNPEWVGVDAYGVRSHRIRRFPIRNPLPHRRRDDCGLRDHVRGPRSISVARADITKRWSGRAIKSSGMDNRLAASRSTLSFCLLPSRCQSQMQPRRPPQPKRFATTCSIRSIRTAAPRRHGSTRSATPAIVGRNWQAISWPLPPHASNSLPSGRRSA